MNVRSCGRMVRGNFTQLETKVTKLEDKKTLTKKEQKAVSMTVKKLEALSEEFQTFHCTSGDQIEDRDKLIEVQEVLSR